jgi:PAS domain S-box-containing protein
LEYFEFTQKIAFKYPQPPFTKQGPAGEFSSAIAGRDLQVPIPLEKFGETRGMEMGIPLRLLIVKDSENDANFLVREVERGGYELTFKRVDTLEHMSAELDRATWDIVISDWRMPHFNAFEALRLMQKRGLDLPFIIVSGEADEDTLVEAMKAGVHDSISNNNLARLLPAIERELREAVVRRERRCMEEALRKERDMTQKYLEVAGVILVVIEASQKVSLINRKGCEILGYKEEEIIGGNWFDTFLPESERERSRALFAMSIGGKVRPAEFFENLILTKNGEEKIISWRNTLLRDQAGNIIGTLSSGEDVTKRKRMEEAANRLAQGNAVMAEMGRIISSALNIEEVYERFAAEARKLIPFDRIAVSLNNPGEGTATITYASGMELEGKRIGDAFPLAHSGSEEVRRTRAGFLVQPEAVEELAGRFPGLIPTFQAGLRSMILAPLISRDQVIGVLHLRSKEPKVYTDRDLRLAERIANQIAGAIANAQLFLERKRAEEALLASEEKYRLLVQNANGAIFIVQDGVIKFPNPKTETLTGYSSTELANMPFINLVRPADRNRVIEQYRNALDGEKVPVFSSRVFDRAGTEKWVEINGIPLNWEGKPAVLVFLRDITEQKNLEFQLMHAQKLDAIGTLAVGIAHDFNNILAAIVGYAELISWEVPQSSRAERNLEQLLKAGRRATDLVRQILAFSRQGREERTPLEIGPIVKEILKLLRASLPSSIEIRQAIENDIGKMEADPTQIHRVLMNLCTNAAHAMRKDGGLLEVSLSRVDMDAGTAAQYPNLLPGRYIKLSVSDTGHGMSPEVLEKIFDPYFTTKEAGEGSGLGLAVVHGIVESLRGAITTSSKPGKGTTFHIYFPQTDYAQATADTQKLEPFLMGGNERILFIDDEQGLVDVGEQILKSLKYEVTVRTSSMEALELFRAHPQRFDLVITDMTMPNMTGDKLAKELLRIRADIPIVLCTGFSEQLREEAAKELGIRELAMKPLVTSDLAKTIRRALHPQKKKWLLRNGQISSHDKGSC